MRIEVSEVTKEEAKALFEDAGLLDIVADVEKRTGYPFSAHQILEVYQHTLRKCEINGKGADYVPILFENELRDAVMRFVINYRGEQNRRKRMEAAVNV